MQLATAAFMLVIIKAKFENGVLTLQVPKKEEIPEEQTKKFITIG